MLQRDGMIVAPGAYDCITAKLIEQAGFPAVYMTGSGTAASLGYPDYGLATMSEMADNAGRIAAAVALPVIADADTGFGNELNMVRTVREYVRRGVAALHVEDQTFPKKCGHLEGKEVVPLDDFLAKIRAAAEERADSDFVIIARTDARAPLGFEKAIRRVNAALEAGADAAFVEAPQTMEEMEAVPGLVNGACLLNIVSAGKSPDVGLDAAETMGYKIAILPSLLLVGAVCVYQDILDELKTSRIPPPPPKDLPVQERFRLFGADEWDGLRDRHRERPQGKAPAKVPAAGE
jgi:2-methylisocitrate lyase-like PEP mutase family enzyme